MKSFSKNILTLLISTFFFLALLEVGVRVLNRHMGQYPQKDPILHHSLVPNAKLKRVNNEFSVTYQINSKGLRDREFPLQKPANTFRILMLGDSFTFGIGSNLEQTFPKLLEEALNAQGKGMRFEVINGGCSSYSPLLHYLFLIHKGLQFQPDLVILNYDISDIQDDYKYSRIAEFDAQGLPVRVKPVDVQFYYRGLSSRYRSKIPLLDRSELYQFVMKRVYELKNERNAPLYYQEAKIIAGNIEYDRDLPMRDNAGDWKPYFEQSARYLRLIHTLLQSKNIGFVLTGYPYGTLISEKEWEIGRKLRGFDQKIYTTKLFDYLAEFSQKEGLPFLNLTPAFRASLDFPLFYSYDGHFTPAGNRVAAKAIHQFLAEHKLLEARP